ncbi:MAG: alpha/beta fold hydrolase [Synergistaceae bacterium]|nr:alpha/beta fold hydrolase [Synergistaceae bacterium]
MKKLLLVIAFLLFPVLACAETINLQIDGSQGKLAAQIQKPEGNSKLPMVMILHGFTSKKEFELLKTLADELEKNHIASIRFDFNAHGQSEGKFENMTVLNEIEDAKKVYDYVKNLDYVDTEKISVAGHSQGGVVASMLAGELGAGKIHKVVLFAPAAVLREDAIRGNVFGVTFDAGNPPESVKIFDGYNLGRDYVLTAQTLKIYETAEKFTGPVCLIHGTGDRVVPYSYSERYNRVYRNSELHLLDGIDHGFNSYWEEAAKIAADFLKK